jgi:PPK2 family polyphosphate:nucleotide phosphotransferase
MPIKKPNAASSCLVPPGKPVRLKDFDPGDTLGPEFAAVAGDTLKKQARRLLEESRDSLAKSQELLWASDAYSVLVVFQGMDTAGKDGTVKHVMTGVNPSACEVHAFKQPTAEELSHDFLWRYAKRVPARGRIGIFNRSYYEDVLVVRVHPKLLESQQLPASTRGPKLWSQRFEDINAFERHLVRNGTVIIKFFLNVSKAEQKRRLLSRLDDKDKHWKFSAADIEERAFWQDYQDAYQAMLGATSTEWAPWYVIPADHKHVARAVVASILSQRIDALGLKYPVTSKAAQRALLSARRRLLGGR